MLVKPKHGDTDIGFVNSNRSLLDDIMKTFGPVPNHVVERADAAWKET